MRRYTSLRLLLSILVAVWRFLLVVPMTNVADNNFANGITVDSTGDGADANLADSICDDGSGNCTLRAAIEESNNEAGTQTIGFNITGTADFTNGGQNGYTIQPSSVLPTVTDTVTIDGYSQPGAQANTAPAPNPLKGRLLIEIDGTNAGVQSGLSVQAPNTQVRGLVINRFSFDGLNIDGNGVGIYGNYIGTDPTGMVGRGNVQRGVGTGAGTGSAVQIGGSLPEQRNLISGNQASAMGIDAGHDGWIIRGNYIGVGSDGLTPIPNAQPGGSGNPSIDNVSDTIVGGPNDSDVNVISGNLGHGIAPYNAPRTTIQNNYIGVGYDGTTPIGNGVAASLPATGGIVMHLCDNPIVLHNIISNNKNDAGGLVLSQSSGGIVQGNVVMNNHGAGVAVSAFSDTLIGGDLSSQANTISNNSGPGIGVNSILVTSIPVQIPSSNNTIIGNSIYNNHDGMLYGLPLIGMGIELMEMETTDLAPVAYTNTGVTQNDHGDVDDGANDYINFPVLNSASQNGSQLVVNLDLDASGTTDPTGNYRIEFFANDAADASGNGEGQTYLGYANISNGTNKTASISLANGTDLTGKVLSATTTAMDNSTTSGFGSTSEFSLAKDVNVTKSSQVDTQADTGDSTMHVIYVALLCIALASIVFGASRRIAARANKSDRGRHV